MHIYQRDLFHSISKIFLLIFYAMFIKWAFSIGITNEMHANKVERRRLSSVLIRILCFVLIMFRKIILFLKKKGKEKGHEELGVLSKALHQLSSPELFGFGNELVILHLFMIKNAWFTRVFRILAYLLYDNYTGRLLIEFRKR